MKVRRRQTRQSKHIISGKGKYWEAEDLCFSLLSDPLAICQRYGDWQLHVKARENVWNDHKWLIKLDACLAVLESANGRPFQIPNQNPTHKVCVCIPVCVCPLVVTPSVVWWLSACVAFIDWPARR